MVIGCCLGSIMGNQRLTVEQGAVRKTLSKCKKNRTRMEMQDIKKEETQEEKNQRGK